jgi:predicted Holliday junction resolvase-like endonuclease
MNISKILLVFYKEQHFIFGICPCCNHIFQLSEASIGIRTKKVILPELKNIMDIQNQVSRRDDYNRTLEEQLFDYREQYSSTEQELEDMESMIEKKYRNEGRRQALKRMKKVDKVFIRRNIDPRDIRLIFNPIEYVAFKGLTEKNEVNAISFVTRHIESKKNEIALSSLSSTIKKGNMEFVLIRIDEDGRISYEKQN